MKEKKWIKELVTPYYAPSYKIKDVLYEKQSKYQDIKIVESYQFGKMLVLDDIVQLTEVDEFIYHEMLVHLPLLTHPNPHSVYIAGAGDGGVLREVLRHPVEKVTMVELDAEVTAACEKYMDISQNAFQDKRVNLLFADASVVLQIGASGSAGSPDLAKSLSGGDSKEQYDIILVDSTDPIGKGENLFSSQFYRDAEKCLTADGLIAVQSGSPIFQPNLLRKVVREFQLLFPIVQVYTAVVPTYPGVYWSLTIGTKKFNPKGIEMAELGNRIKQRGLNFKYYSPKIHHASFVLPEFVKSIISNELKYGIFRSPDLIWKLKDE